MGSRRPGTIRRTVALGVVLGVALAGCSSKPQPPREGGGAAGSKADKARKDAEALALAAVAAGADAQAKAVPEAAVRPSRRTGFFNVMVTTAATVKEVFVAKAPAAPPAPAQKAASPPTPQAPPDRLVPTAPEAAGKGVPEVATKAPPAPKTAPRGGAPVVVRERVVSTVPYTTEAEAEDDALVQARDLVESKLAALDPPVRHKPSPAEVRAEFVRKDTRTVRAPDADERAAFAQYGVSGSLVYVEFDVEVTGEQVRELRAQERVSAGLRVLGMLFAVALAGFLFLRADEWTRGYLTSWLALGAVALAAGAAAAFICV